MVRKVEEKFEETKNVENNDNSEKYILRGDANARYNDKVPSKSEKNNKNFNASSILGYFR